MRKILLFVFSMLLLVTSAANAATEKKATIWTGEQEFASDWSNNIMFSIDQLPTLTAGDELHFTVTAIADPSGWPQIKLNRYDWVDFATALSFGLWDQTAPCEGVIALTQEAIDEITESGGFVLFGAGYTCTEMSLYGQAGESSSTDVWTGEQECTDSWGGSVMIPSSDLPELAVGDEIAIEVSAISSTCEWPQVKIAQYTWTDFTTNISIGLWDATAPCTVSVALTQDNIDEIASSGGIVVYGAGYTMTKISIKQAKAIDEGANINVWEGEKVIPLDWGAYLQLPASSFINAKKGYLLRMSITDLKAGATGHLCNGYWSELPDATDYPALSGHYFQYTITDDMLKELQSTGLVVFGCGYTLTSVDLINPDNLPKFETTLEFDKEGRVWTESEPCVLLDIESQQESDYTFTVGVEVFSDKREAVMNYTEDLAISAGGLGSTIIVLDEVTEPGFYTVNTYVADELVKSVVIGVKPEEIVSAVDAQSDFDEFWKTAINELATVEPNYTLTELTDKSTDARKVYLVEMQSLTNDGTTPVTIRAYYAEPTAEGTYPCCIHFCGYDGGTDEPWCMAGDDHEGWCDLIVSMRGQMINNRDPYKEDNSFYGDWFAYNFGNKDQYYYRGAYADAVRAIDFVCSREKVDQKNIFAQGSSQGGAFTLAAAALDTRLNAIAPSVPFMGDFPDYFQMASWPASVATAQQTALGLSDDDMYAFLSYFDTKNLAPNITCPVLECIGLLDTTCPPHTNIAPYNNLASANKQIIYNPDLGHATASDWWDTMFTFFDKYMVTTGINEVNATANTDSQKVYNLAGQQVEKSYRGIVVSDGKKYIRK